MERLVLKDETTWLNVYSLNLWSTGPGRTFERRENEATVGDDQRSS